MTRPASRYPTELELEIPKILWRDGPAPVRRVRDSLAETRDLAYTSVMTVLNIMVEKKYVRRRRRGGSYVYRPCVTHEWTARRMLGDVVERLFDGSASAALLHLLESGEIDAAELEALRQTLADKEGVS